MTLKRWSKIWNNGYACSHPDVCRVHPLTYAQLMELRQPPVSLNDPTSTGSIDGTNPLSGILGSILGESPEAQKARLEEASKGANDLTNLVKRKKSSNGATPEPPKELPSRSSAKRKVAFAEEIEEVGTGKKARIENPGET